MSTSTMTKMVLTAFNRWNVKIHTTQNESDEAQDGKKKEKFIPKRISHEIALTYADDLNEYLESKENSQLANKLIMRKLSMLIRKKRNTKKQNYMTDYFKQI